MSTDTTARIIRHLSTSSDFWSAARAARGAKDDQIASDDSIERLEFLASTYTDWITAEIGDLVMPGGVVGLYLEVLELLQAAHQQAGLLARAASRPRVRLTVALTREGDHLLSWMAII